MSDAPSINPSTGRIRLSASKMQTWIKCPLQAKFKYIDLLEDKQGAAATFGSCVHKAMEHYVIHHDVEVAVKIFKAAWHKPLRYGIPEPQVWYKGQSFGGYMKAGEDAIRAFHQQARWKKTTFIATEHPFLVPFGDDFELTGYVDLIEVSKDSKGQERLSLLDFKTSKKKPIVSELRGNVQFTVYDYASTRPEFWLGSGDPRFPPMPNGDWWWTFTKDMPRQNLWYGLMQGQAWDAGERDQADFERLHRVASEIKRALEYEVFVPNLSGLSCSQCPYTKECRLPFDPDKVWSEDRETTI